MQENKKKTTNKQQQQKNPTIKQISKQTKPHDPEKKQPIK